jgi:threonylcarbamoyladenosine tRNA methylthiotransferase MtaB
MERELVKARANRLRQAAQERRALWLEGLVGTRQTVLVENSEKGHSDGFAPVRIAGSTRGDFGAARIFGRDSETLIGMFE